MKFSYIIIFLCLSFSLIAQPQLSTEKKSAIKLFKTAQQNYYNAQYKDAVDQLDEALKKDKNFIEAYLLKAQIYFELGDVLNESLEYEKVLNINRNYSPKVQYLLSISYFNLEKYKASLDICKEAQQMEIPSERLARLIENGIEASAFALELFEHPVPYNPVNLGENINSPYDDYWPMISTDGTKLYTTKNVPIRNDMPYGRNNANEDFFINYLGKDSTWGPAFEIGFPLNTKNNEGAPSISADGQTFAFTACNRNDGYGKCDLYISKRTQNGWTNPKNIGEPINTPSLERHPSLSPDGKTIYFASDRPGTDGLEDIWVSHLIGEHWTNPVNLGDSVNSNGMEWAPFIHPDGVTLYFVSNGHLGMGGLDIFKSTRINDTTWTQPQNLGYPINTVFDEQSLFVSVGGDLALISSSRANDGKGLDIYSFELPEASQPNFVSYVEGVIVDATTKKSLQAKIELIDLQSGQLIMQPESDADNGSYLLCLPSNKDYMLNISKTGYLPYSEHFELSKSTRQVPLKKNIELQAIEMNAHFILKNIFFALDSYELENKSKLELGKLIAFLNQNPNVAIEISGHTDNQGSREHNLKLSNNRAKTVYEYLLNESIPASRLTYKGFGFDQPIDTNDTEIGRAKNRRTEFKIVGL